MARTPSNGIINKRVMNIIETAVKRALNDYSKDIYKDMANAYRSVIDTFYNDYTPSQQPSYVRYYGKKYQKHKRRYALYKASSGYKYRGIKNDIIQIENGYDIWLHIGVEQMKLNGVSQKTHRADLGWIFERSYIGFIHGFTAEENKKWYSGDGRRWITKHGRNSGQVSKWWMPRDNYVGQAYDQLKNNGVEKIHSADIRKQFETMVGQDVFKNKRYPYIPVPNNRVPSSGVFSYQVTLSGQKGDITPTKTSKKGLAKKMEFKIRDIKKSLKSDTRFSEHLKNRLKL